MPVTWPIHGASGSGGTSTDHHSGYYLIPSSTTVTIASGKQMVVFGGIVIDGDLVINGQFIEEP